MVDRIEGWYIIIIIILVIFILNIYINFFTEVTIKGILCNNREIITPYYFRTMFFYDFISIFSLLDSLLYLEGTWRIFNLLGFLKMPSLFKTLSNLKEQYNRSIEVDDNNNLTNLLKLIELFLIVLSIGHVKLIYFYKYNFK